MKTPIFDFVKAYADKDISRFHMPGHKGKQILGCESMDITEIDGADVLAHANGIIEESEKYASELFGTENSFYSTEGSSLAIKAMLGLVARTSVHSGVRPRILAARNAHKAFLYACALLDLEVEWLYPEMLTHICNCHITPRQVENALKNSQSLPMAVYLTSPDYLGNIADIKGIADVCHGYGIPLLVDNAHGAYLRFLSPSRHPIDLGADLCCDSAHKTLPVLTGGAYLHISKKADPRFCVMARDMLSVFASTSPSYLILSSLDLCNRYLADHYSERLQTCVRRIEQTKSIIRSLGFCIEPTEPLKMVIHGANAGYTGTELATQLREHKIEVEFSDEEYLVLMISPENQEHDFLRLEEAFSQLSIRTAISTKEAFTLQKHERVLSVREAIFSLHERIPIEKAEGRICASPTVSCPPAIPIAVSGERISYNTVKLLRRYGIKEIEVVVTGKKTALYGDLR